MKTSCCNSKESISIGNSIVCLNAICNNYLGQTNLYCDFLAWKKPVVISFFAVQMMFSMEDFSMENKENNFKMFHVNSRNFKPLSFRNLRQELEVQKVLCADEVYAQMKLETGTLSSPLLRHTNNLMGMRYPFIRPTTACGIFIPSKNKIIYGDQQSLRQYSKFASYAVYKCWQDAVADYKLWQDHNFKVKERYLDYLGKVYAEDSLYVAKIKDMTTKEY